MTDMKWFMEQQELRDRVISKLAEMGIKLDEDDAGEHYDTDSIVDDVFDTMVMVEQYKNGLVSDGHINEDYTPEMFYMDMLIIQVIRYISNKHGWDIEMEPIYEDDE
jgi:hypothetical protein